MILWFAGGSCLLVWLVFRDPRIDPRLVVLGALLPDVALRLTPLHSVTFSVALLFAVMAATRRGTMARRRALAVPIGTFLHLVLDGMWTRATVFWWPFLGSFKWGRLPTLDRPAWVLVAMEAAGLAALWWYAGARAAAADPAGGPPPEVPTC